MLKTERKQLILEELNQHHVVSRKLVSLLETSESTVRRDLDELEAENKLRRVHGGAELPTPYRKKKPFKKNLSKTFKKRSCWLRKQPLSLKKKMSSLSMLEQQLLF